MKYIKLKNELKDLADEIRGWKYQRDNWYNFTRGQWYYQLKVLRSAFEFRHMHIAYCLLRGREYDVIERPREGNEPDMYYVRSIMEPYEQKKAESGTV